jgi:DNA-binding NarL/FixJ family response regulator
LVQGRVRILVLDEHSVVRAGVRALVEQDPRLEVVAEAGRPADLSEGGPEPDVVVTGLVFDGIEVREVVPTVQGTFPKASILILTMIDDPDEVRAALAAGARGYVLKTATPREFTEAVLRVADGERYVEPSLGAAMATRGDSEDGNDDGLLSEREREVLTWIALGHTNTEIAATLEISLRTVETHRSHIYQKLGLHTRAELVQYARVAGLTSSSEDAT